MTGPGEHADPAGGDPDARPAGGRTGSRCGRANWRRWRPTRMPRRWRQAFGAGRRLAARRRLLPAMARRCMTPPPRRGPRPLPLHLALALRRGAALALPRRRCRPARPDRRAGAPAGRARSAGQAERRGSPPASPPAATRLRPSPPRSARACGARTRRCWPASPPIAGTPTARDLPDPPAIWAEGGSRLLDYGGRRAPVVLFVPSLVNRA